VSHLKLLQQGFQAYVLKRGEFAQAIVSDERATAEQRLQVYYDAYRLRLAGVLREDFAGLASLVSDTDWSNLALGYLARHPSKNPSVRWLGRHLASYLARTEPWSARPELAEMAAFEWAWGRCFDAPDRAALNAAELQAVAAADWPRLRFEMHPAMRLLELHSNVPALYRSVAAEESMPSLCIRSVPACWILWRHELRVHWRSAPADEAAALAAVCAGQAFDGMCTAMAEQLADEQVPARAVQIIQQWLVDGLLVGLRID